MRVIKRRTPFDTPSILEAWKELHRYYVKDLGLSNRQAYYRISEEYGCHWTTPRRWIETNIRLHQ